MATINISNNFDKYNADLIKGANMILSAYNGSQTISNISHLERIHDWHKLDKDIYFPLPYPVPSNMELEIDFADGRVDTGTIVGGVFLGTETDDKTVVCFKDTENESMMVDILMASFLWAIDGDYRMAHSMIQSLFALMGLHSPKTVVKPETRRLEYNVKPYTI